MIGMESGCRAQRGDVIGVDGMRAVSARISRTSVAALLISMLMLMAVLMPDTDASAQNVAWTARSQGGTGQLTGSPGCGNTITAKGAMAIDAAGNSYVTGCSPNGSNYDYLTVKFDAAGAVVWQVRYNGTGNGTDQAHALSVDASGNVYVTGTSFGASSNNDYATIKYDSSGVQQWVAIYNGTGDGHDQANALSVDASGNVYVTGTSVNAGGDNNYATIKYDSAGVQQWVAHYGGASFDQATALSVDASGNVYVTGYVRNASDNYDYATIKYSIAGVQQWAAIYNGTGDGYDQANALSIDAIGNVYVTGQSYGASGDLDYATIKYDSAGVQQWAAIHNGTGDGQDQAHALSVDASGNVHVTGQSHNVSGNDDYVTIKYNSAGVQQWIAIYNGTGGNSDVARAISMDGSGNVYVTGQAVNASFNYDYATIKYNSAGVQQWAAIYNSTGNDSDSAYALSLDSSGNVYVTGSSFNTRGVHNYATIKYNNIGVQQWAGRPGLDTGFSERFACNNSLFAKGALAIDSLGNSYMTGCSYNGTNYDYQTTKLDAAGAQQWSAIYNGTGNSQDEAYALSVDASGNVYVTGTSIGASGGYNYATIKYNSAGVQQWAAIYNGTADNDDRAYALTVDDSGNVYVTGTAIGSGFNPNFVTVKYNHAGVLQWAAPYSGAGRNVDAAYALSVDASGNVYVTGFTPNEVSHSDYITIKYNSAGAQQWSAIYNGSSNRDDQANALSVDVSGNVYVTGHSYNASGDLDYATIKYNSAGVQQWAAIYSGTADSYDEAKALSVDINGNVYVTGYTRNESGNGDYSDFATIKYNSAGVQQWAAIYNGPGNGLDYASALSVDASGNAYVTGQSYSANGDLDYATIKYDSAGVQRWVHRFDGTRSSNDRGLALALAPDGGILVAGTENNETGSDRMTVQKIIDTPAITIFLNGFE